MLLLIAAELPEPVRNDILAAWFVCGLLLQLKQSPEAVTSEKRATCSKRLDAASGTIRDEVYHGLMYKILFELGEFKRAIPFAERLIEIAAEAKNSLMIGDKLWQLGKCYSQLGLRDQASVAHRAAVKIFRSYPSDPRLPAILLSLATSLRKSAPTEAERLYQEAAAIWEGKGQLESATPAWVNLAILCSDQQRFDEALAYYERVRRIREGTPGTARAKIGTLYNNLANCYRKMARFTEAHAWVDRALRVFNEPGISGGTEAVNSHGLVFGSRALILRDEGRDAESVEWFERAIGKFESLPNPNFDLLIAELEYLAEVLKRLQRTEEAAASEAKIAELRDKMAAIRGVEPQADVEIAQGTVLIELDFGIRDEAGKEPLRKLGLRVNQELEEKGLGKWQGWVQIIESSTLICTGGDAEAIHAVVEPMLRDEPRAEGARITIRQGTTQREVMMPRRMIN